MVKKQKAGKYGFIMMGTEESIIDSLVLLFVVSMICAAFSSILSVLFYARGLLSAGGQFTLLAVMLMIMAMQAYAVILMKKE